MRYFEQSFSEWARERKRRIGPVNFGTKLSDRLLSPDSRLAFARIRGNHWVDYTLMLLPMTRSSNYPSITAHHRLLHTITAKTLCQMERSGR